MISDSQRESLIYLAAIYGVEEDNGGLRLDYSGRGMFGKRCPAIVTNCPTTLIESAARSGVTGAATDDMGRDTVVYWPNL